MTAGQRGNEARKRSKAVQAPARRARQIELLDGHGKAVAEGLGESFLARPALEESQRPVVRGESRIRRVLAARKKSCCDVVGFANGAHRFDIDSHIAFA